MFHPTRGGNRGGQGLFKWDSVKDDKHRENYLGHSLMAPVGRWQKDKDLTWYDKKQNADASDNINRELQSIRELEAEAMAEALGYGGPKRRLQSGGVSKDELKNAMKGVDIEVPEAGAGTGERKGLGYDKSSLAISAPQDGDCSAPNGEGPVAAIDNVRNDVRNDARNDASPGNNHQEQIGDNLPSKRTKEKKHKKERKHKKDKKRKSKTRSRSRSRSGSPSRSRSRSRSRSPAPRGHRRDRSPSPGRDSRRKHQDMAERGAQTPGRVSANDRYSEQRSRDRRDLGDKDRRSEYDQRRHRGGRERR
ncbi:kinase phosphorylation protein-domain-containing protein [Polychytrium aggregatum]|uniref:kinase phosphorylation protein-domain-containing protein n=1 Tax=Polychytrium aggregatum TaxID=110093 RepID=UPI0022FE4158|nr:kinase phosphorylation protein-domain-containing protein [Polychytrium aggregatum]KAI9197298.1 kinase phosphorylation protein-domain-containing protein [Polychytrium aggregatum]